MNTSRCLSCKKATSWAERPDILPLKNGNYMYRGLCDVCGNIKSTLARKAEVEAVFDVHGPESGTDSELESDYYDTHASDLENGSDFASYEDQYDCDNNDFHPRQEPTAYASGRQFAHESYARYKRPRPADSESEYYSEDSGSEAQSDKPKAKLITNATPSPEPERSYYYYDETGLIID